VLLSGACLDNSTPVPPMSEFQMVAHSSPLLIQAGIGTYFAPGAVSPMFTWLAKILDEAFAW